MIDGLFSISAVAAVWETVKNAIGAVLDWLADKFASVWGAISPVIDGLKWVRDKGAGALAGLGLGSDDAASAAASGAKPSATNPSRSGLATSKQAEVLARQGERLGRLGVPGYATGGNFSAGPIIVGERGPELRYENRGGFIAHHGALRSLASMSQRARDLAHGAAASLPTAPPSSVPAALAPPPGRAPRAVSYAPVYNVSINGSGLDATTLRGVVRAELQAQDRRAQTDLRRLMHD